MTANLVTVNATLAGTSGDPGQGHWLFAATGTLMSATYVAIVAPVIDGSLDGNGQFQYTNPDTGVISEGVPLLASDNFAAGDLLWNFFGSFSGMASIHVTNMIVNFASGASQNLWTILAANGWTPEQA